MNSFLISLLIMLPLVSFSQADENSHALKDLIIRSNAKAFGKSLVGIKGKAPGSGMVYEKTSKSSKWMPTNMGKPLNPDVADVQSVAIVNDSIYLAGTWKNGMYRTTDAGLTWKKMTHFPSHDIRSIQVGKSNRKLVYAATTTHGIMKSMDMGETWKTTSKDSLAKALSSWSIELDPSNDMVLYAMTFKNGIYQSIDGGKNWKFLLKHNDMLFYDLAISVSDPSKLWAVGCNDSLGAIYVSEDMGNQWKSITNVPEGGLNEICAIGKNQKVLIIGSWDKGVFVYENQKWNHVDEVTFNTITDITADQDEIHIYTWGNGIYTLKNRW